MCIRLRNYSINKGKLQKYDTYISNLVSTLGWNTSIFTYLLECLSELSSYSAKTVGIFDFKDKSMKHFIILKTIFLKCLWKQKSQQDLFVGDLEIK